MRIAPVGLLAPRDRAFSLGAEVAALTHGHPSGYLAAGFMAAVIAAVRDGEPLGAALDGATVELERHQGAEETLAAISVARRLVDAGAPSAERVQGLGGGWVAEQALAIALYAVLATDSFAERSSLPSITGATRTPPARSPATSPGSSSASKQSRRRGWSTWSCATRSHEIAEDLHRATKGRAQWDPEQEWDRYPGW